MTELDGISAALERNEFFLVYLPTVSLLDERCVGAEALIRWRQRNQVVLDARQFIPLTDNTPLSGRITYWVIDTIAAEIGAWLAAHEEAFIGINVPPEILGRGGLYYAGEKSGLRDYARQVVLEVTERGIPDRLGLDALNAMANSGVRIALDDMTISGANLALLTRCRFEMVKIDRSLVAQLVPDNLQPTWLAGLGTLLKSTPLQVVAEGVETRLQADVLKAAGVQMAQGHHFSAPLTAEAFMRYYAGNCRT